MKTSRPIAVYLVGFVLLGAITWWLGSLTRQSTSSPVAAPPSWESSGQILAAPKENGEDHSPEAILARMFARLRSSAPNPGELDIFRAALLGGDPGQAIAAIRKFLSTGQDALTGETFAIGANGELSGAPTFRVLLLDMLGRLSREHGGGDAGAVARALLGKKPAESTADEWAIALRNAAWANPGDLEYLSGKTRELMGEPQWRNRPTAGYYEAFDLIVYTRDVRFISELAGLVNGEDVPLKTTAATTLDRLAAMAPLDVMNFLNQNPAELSDKPFLRSDYYAKADFSQAAQRAAVEAYLDRTDVDARAKSKVVAALGQPGVFVSENLLTETPVVVDDIPAVQKIALQQALQEWLRGNRYPSLRSALLDKQEALK